MCPNFTFVNHRPVLSLAYALCGATANGHVLCKAHMSAGLATCAGQPTHSPVLMARSFHARKYRALTP